MSSVRISRRKLLILGGLMMATTAADSLPGASSEPVAGDVAGMAGHVAGAAASAARIVVPPVSYPIAVAAQSGKDYAEVTRKVIDAIGGASVLASPGERVVIKPALAWDRQPGYGVNVHPDVLRTLISLVLGAGASQVIVFDRTGCAPAWAYRVSGALDAVRAIGDARVQLTSLTPADFVPLSNAHLDTAPGTASLSGAWVCRHVLDADRVINVATLRQHPVYGALAGMANLQGLIGGESADAAWHKNRDLELVALSAAIRPALTVLDATSAVLRNGPLGNSLADVVQLHTVVTSRDPVAVESMGLRLFAQAVGRANAPGLPHIALAEQLGLGTALRADRMSEQRVIDLRTGGKA